VTETTAAPAAVPVGYAGLVTRAVAFLIDLFTANAIVVLTGGAIDLLARLLGGNESLNARQALAGGTVWFLWLGLYFVLFWTLTGQTPGDRLMSIRVFSSRGGRIRIRQAVLRFIGLLLAAVPLGAGFLPILVDDRRRGFHDWLARTVVRWDSKAISESPSPERAISESPSPERAISQSRSPEPAISPPEADAPVVPVAGQSFSVG
jgi:uncharacterized RDD family membrane protein YckC